MRDLAELGNKKAEERFTLIEHMLTEVEEHYMARGESSDFIESLRSWFDLRETLTPAQFDALEKVYERL